MVPGVFIPRPASESLVHAAVDWALEGLKTKPSQSVQVSYSLHSQARKLIQFTTAIDRDLNRVLLAI